MLEFDQAREKLLSQAQCFAGKERVTLAEAAGRVLATDVTAAVNVPPFNNSAMDGIAFCFDDVSESSVFDITQEVFAGDAPMPLVPGTAARIYTGAMIPEGADTVELQENCTFEGGRVTLNEKVVQGQHIRCAGEDIAIGKQILGAGVQLDAASLGLLASVGCAEVEVYKQLNVAVLATGSELLEPGQALKPGQIYNSNQYMVGQLVAQLGMQVSTHHIEDDAEALQECIAQLINSHDVLITIGGVSVGKADYVKSAIESLGSLSLWKVAMKPGKPLSYGEIHGKPVIGLPGNPVSAFATFQLFAADFLRLCQGGKLAAGEAQYYPVMLAKSTEPRREEFLRVQLVKQEGEWVLQPYPHQGSGVLSSVVWATGFARIPRNTITHSGDRVEYIPFK